MKPEPLAPAPVTQHRGFPVLLMVTIIALDVVTFLLQKKASRTADASGHSYIAQLLMHPWAWLALAIGPVQLWIWTRILARTDISVAYPLVSLQLPVTMVAAWLVFHERAPWPVCVGGILITLGAAAIGPTHDADEPAAASPQGAPTP